MGLVKLNYFKKESNIGEASQLCSFCVFIIYCCVKYHPQTQLKMVDSYYVLAPEPGVWVRLS